MIQVGKMNTDQALRILFTPTPDEILEFYNTPYPIRPEHIAFYARNGFVHLPDLLNHKALVFLQRVIQAAVLIRKFQDERSLSEKSAYEQSFLQCGFLCWDFKPVKDFVFGKRFAGIARDLLQVKHVRLWHDQALFKEPGGRETDVHIDSSYWPLNDPTLSTTLWLALNDVPQEKGCLYFYPESHKWPEHEYVDIFKNPHRPSVLKGQSRIPIPLKAGEATFHSGLVYHGAGPNKTDQMREGMTVIYIADGLRFDARDERNRTHTSCQGLRHGEVINTPLTPVLI